MDSRYSISLDRKIFHLINVVSFRNLLKRKMTPLNIRNFFLKFILILFLIRNMQLKIYAYGSILLIALRDLSTIGNFRPPYSLGSLSKENLFVVSLVILFNSKTIKQSMSQESMLVQLKLPRNVLMRS